MNEPNIGGIWAVLFLITIVFIAYLVWVGVAWVIIWAFELGYSPWAVGVALIVINAFILNRGGSK